MAELPTEVMVPTLVVLDTNALRSLASEFERAATPGERRPHGALVELVHARAITVTMAVHSLAERLNGLVASKGAEAHWAAIQGELRYLLQLVRAEDGILLPDDAIRWAFDGAWPPSGTRRDGFWHALRQATAAPSLRDALAVGVMDFGMEATFGELVRDLQRIYEGQRSWQLAAVKCDAHAIASDPQYDYDDPAMEHTALVNRADFRSLAVSARGRLALVPPPVDRAAVERLLDTLWPGFRTRLHVIRSASRPHGAAGGINLDLHANELMDCYLFDYLVDPARVLVVTCENRWLPGTSWLPREPSFLSSVVSPEQLLVRAAGRTHAGV